MYQLVLNLFNCVKIVFSIINGFQIGVDSMFSLSAKMSTCRIRLKPTSLFIFFFADFMLTSDLIKKGI